MFRNLNAENIKLYIKQYVNWNVINNTFDFL